jgi:hypothetical protein
MQTAGAEKTSELVLEGFTTMNQRWMKRRIEKSRARCEATEKHRSTQISHEAKLEQLPSQFSRVIEEQSLKLRLQAKVE